MTQKKYPEKPILMVDDEDSWLTSMEALLLRHGKINNLITCSDSRKVMPLLADQEFSLVLLDFGLPHLAGDELLAQMKLLYPQLPVIMLTGHNQVDTAVYCKDLGAVNYLVKTEDGEVLADKIIAALRDIYSSPRSNASAYIAPEFADIIALSSSMKSALRQLTAARQNPLPLLLVGEKGVGKKFLAQRLMSKCAGQTRVFDGEAYQEIRFMDEAWTANLRAETRQGFIFLENLDALDPENQLHLLQILQHDSGARFISALDDMQQARDGLREDLYNLLQANMIQIPPLRSRKKDLPGLTRQFFQQAADEYQKKPPTPPAELELLLNSYSFPGNIAELKKMIFFAVKAHKSKKLSMDQFKKLMATTQKAHSAQLIFSETLPTIEETINLLIEEAEKRAEGNQAIMANMLGISRQALNRRLNRKKNSS